MNPQRHLRPSSAVNLKYTLEELKSQARGRLQACRFFPFRVGGNEALYMCVSALTCETRLIYSPFHIFNTRPGAPSPHTGHFEPRFSSRFSERHSLFNFGGMKWLKSNS